MPTSFSQLLELLRDILIFLLDLNLAGCKSRAVIDHRGEPKAASLEKRGAEVEKDLGKTVSFEPLDQTLLTAR